MWKINIDMRYSESGFKLTESELQLMAKMKAHSFVGIISDWVKDGMRDNYMSYFEQVHAVLEFEASGYARLTEERMLGEHMEKANMIGRKKCLKAC